MLKITLTFEMDEEQLREIFDSYDIKFTKKKARELQSEMAYSLDNVQVDMEERFQEVVEEFVDNHFNE